MAQPLKYSDKQIQKLLQGIHDGTINDRALPEDLYYAIADYLKKGLYEGFGSDLTSAEGEYLDNLIDLRDNIYLFAGAKTFQFTKEAGELITDEDGQIRPFSEFKAEAEQLYGQYNEDWLQAEYNTTIGQAQMANQWQQIEDTKEQLPFLTFSTAGNPCDECEPFESLTAPVDDPIWDICTPLLHFNCMCILEQHDEDAIPSTKEFIDNLPVDDIPDTFKNNPGKTGEIFTKDHPYFDVDKGDRSFAKKNFDLPIPEEDE